MKNQMCKKWLALAVAMLFLLGLASFSLISGVAAADQRAAEDPYMVMLPGEDLHEGVMEGANHVSCAVTDTSLGKVMRLSVASTTNDPFISFHPEEAICNADTYRYILVLVKSDLPPRTDVKLNLNFEIFYTNDTVPKYTGAERISTTYSRTDDWQFLTFDLSQNSGWTGNIKSLRFDFFAGSEYQAGEYCDIGAVVFVKDEASLEEAAFETAKARFAPVQTLSDFKANELSFVNGGTKSTSVSIADGNIVYSSVLNAEGTYEDPMANFQYNHLVDSRGIQKLTTEDFRYTVIRYRTNGFISPSHAHMELIVCTGDAKSLMDMIRIEGTYNTHSGGSKYDLTKSWKSMVIDMADDDGKEENTGLKYGWQGRGSVNFFRVDWCNVGEAGYSLTISDFVLFKDKAAADSFSSAINSINVASDTVIEPDGETDTDTEHIVMPWETETEETETLPVFSEDTEAPDSAELDSTDETEDKGESGSETESESLTGNGGSIDNGGVEEETEAEETGSEMPFYIACGALGLLSVASVAVVIVIRIREHM